MEPERTGPRSEGESYIQRNPSCGGHSPDQCRDNTIRPDSIQNAQAPQRHSRPIQILHTSVIVH